MEKIIVKLQNEEKLFLAKTLICNGISIQPTEIEPYYYKKGVFEDESVHQNELQTRSAIINGEPPVIGPNKVYRKIKEICHLNEEGLENLPIKLVPNKNDFDVLFSKRINLTKGFIDYRLRAVLCDENFKNSKYPLKEKMVVDFITQNNMSKNRAIEYAKDKLGYIPSSIK